MKSLQQGWGLLLKTCKNCHVKIPTYKKTGNICARCGKPYTSDFRQITKFPAISDFKRRN